MNVEVAEAVATPTSGTRMSAADRREQILVAATAVFGAKSYAGTTTDVVAKAAGVSQPYVVRLFGTKEQLYIEVVERSYDRILEEFRRALPGAAEQRTQRLGAAYTGLLAERGLLAVIAGCTTMGGDPVIGPIARAGFTRLWQFIREEAGYSTTEAREFFAIGMLINTVVGLRLTDGYGEEVAATEVLDECFPDVLDRVREYLPQGGEPW